LTGTIEEVERDAYRVWDVMSTDIKTIAPDADAMEAFQQMQQTGVGRLPVVDETGNLVGIISRSDLMRAFNVVQKGGASPSVGQSEPEISLV
jgi:CBS domain-containing protein